MKFIESLFKNIWPSKIKFQLMLAVSMILLLLMTFFVIDLVNRQKSFLNEQNQRQAQSLVETFAINAKSGIMNNDLEGLSKIVESHKNFPYLKYAMILSTDGQVLAHTDKKYIGMKINDSISLSLKPVPEIQTLVDDGTILDIAAPIINKQHELIGWARIGQSEEHIKNEQLLISEKGMLYILFAIIIGSFVSVIIGKVLTENLNMLVIFTKHIRKGAGGLRIGENNCYEINELGKSINSMMNKIELNEKSLEESVSLLGTTLESTADAILVTDAKGGIITYNKKFVTLWNIPNDILTSMDDMKALDFAMSQLKEPENFINKVNELYNKKNEVSFDSFEFKDGRICERYSQPQFIKGECVGRVWSFRNVTDQKNAEKALKESEEKFYKAFHLSPDIILITRLSDSKIIDVNGKALAYSGYDRSEVMGMKITDLNIWGDQIERDEVISIFNEKGHIHNFEKQFKTKSGEIKYSSVSAEIIELNGEKCIISVIHDITENKKSENEIKERITQLQMLGDNLPKTMIYQLVRELNGDYKFIYLSKVIELITGKKAEEIMQNAELLYDLLVGDDLNLVQDKQEESFRNMSVFNVEVRIKNVSGEINWYNLHSVPRKLSDGRILWDGVQIDITERKLSENIIKVNEEKYRTLIDQASDAIVIYSLDGTIHDFNEIAHTSVGYTKDEYQQLTVSDLIDDEHRIQFTDEIIATLKAGKSCLFHSQIKRKDGSIIKAELNIRLFPDNKIIAMIRDATIRIEAEQKLKESEDKFSKAFHISPDIILISNTQDGIIMDVNESIFHLLNYTRDEVVGNSFGQLGIFTDNNIRQKYHSVLQEQGKVINFEIPFRAKGGEIKHTLVSGDFIELKGEKYLLTIIRDITDRKKSEDALIKSLQEITDYKYALDQSSILSMTDEHGIIKYVNNNFCELYEFTMDELVGKNHNQVVNSGIHPPEFWQNLWSSLRNGKVFQAEICNKSKSGKLYWQDTTIVPFLNENGKPYQYLAIRSDITEKRRLEKNLIEEKINSQKAITEITIQTQEKEKNKLGAELHDNISQILTASKMYLGIYKTRHKDADELINMSHNFLSKALEEIRFLSHSLVAPSMGNVELSDAINDLINEEKFYTGLNIEFKNEIQNTTLQLDGSKKMMFYRILQEQLNNINKYAKAKQVSIHLFSKDDHICLTIVDDGIGFDTTKKSKGIGLINIENRVEFYAGTWEIISSVGNGCTLKIKIPN